MKLKTDYFFQDSQLLAINALISNDIEHFEILVDNDIINKVSNGMTMLSFCLIEENINAIRVLLKNGANIMVKIPELGSPLLIACKSKNVNILKAILEYGIDTNIKINEEPLTFSAAISDNFEGVKVLLDYGVDINARDTIGNTLLIESLFSDDIEIIRLLIDRGANVHLLNCNLISAPYLLQDKINRGKEKNINYVSYLDFKSRFEKAGIKFPVLIPGKLKEKLGIQVAEFENVIKFDENGNSVY